MSWAYVDGWGYIGVKKIKHKSSTIENHMLKDAAQVFESRHLQF